MGKSLLSLLFFASAIAPLGARAATLYGSGYARVGVPDMEQAVGFFRNVLDCRLIDPDSAIEVARRNEPASRLLSCDAGSVIELFDNEGMSPFPVPGKSGQPLQFVSDDVLHADEWLRHEGVSVNGLPHRLTSGPLAGWVVLNFVSPWGLPLELLGRDAHVASANGALATAGVRFNGN